MVESSAGWACPPQLSDRDRFFGTSSRTMRVGLIGRVKFSIGSLTREFLSGEAVIDQDVHCCFSRLLSQPFPREN